MFNPNIKPEQNLDANIAVLEQTLHNHEWNSPEYKECLALLERLHTIKANAPQKRGVDPNTAITAFANLAGIAIIVGYERMNIITTKALTLLVKPRLG